MRGPCPNCGCPCGQTPCPYGEEEGRTTAALTGRCAPRRLEREVLRGHDLEGRSRRLERTRRPRAQWLPTTGWPRLFHRHVRGAEVAHSGPSVDPSISGILSS